MSWYADICGAIITTPDALPMLKELVGDWMNPGTEGSIEWSKRVATLSIEFAGTYRNLGRYLPEAIAAIAQKHPARGEFSIMSMDGGTFAATHRVEGRKMFRTALSDAPEQEVILRDIPGIGPTLDAKNG